jgi:moderate conductance mechanosensitive channel
VDFDLNDALRWIVAHGLVLVIGVAVLLVIYRLTRPAIHRIVPRLLHVQAATLSGGTATPDEELGKRSATLEDLLDTLLRAFVVVGLVVLVLGVFDLWSILAGLALVAAAITVASQEVVLDYVMGVLILLEGPYFKGDWISVDGQAGGIEGEVQEIALRRTMLRDNLGAVHAVSNGLIRASSNLTRVFSVAVVEVGILHAGDLDRAIAVVGRVSREVQADPEWAGRVLADRPDTFVTALTVDGASIRLQVRVPPGARMAVSSELRRRLAAAFVAASIGIARWDTPLPIATGASRSGLGSDGGPPTGGAPGVAQEPP